MSARREPDRLGARDGADDASTGHPPGAAFARGTAVAAGGRALLLTGPSGAGKSSLALDMIARGALLVADDGVWVEPGPDGPWAVAPATAGGRIEARGLGLLRAPATPRARLVGVVDLAQEERERLPAERRVTLGGASLRLFHGVGNPSFAAALLVYLLCNAE